VVGLSIIDPLLGAYFQTRGLRLALRVGEPFRVVRALAMEAAHVSTAGSPAAARVRALLGTAEELASGLDSPQARGMIQLVRGISGLMLGQWDRSRMALDQAETLFRNHCTGVTWERDTVSSLALWDLLYLGQIAELRHRWSVLTKEAKERGDLYAATTLTTSFLAIIRLADNDPAGVEEELSGVVGGWTRRGFSIQHSAAFRSLMQLDLYLGRVDSAWDRAGSVWPEYSRSMLLRIQFIRIQMLELRARSALALAEQGKGPDAALISAGHDARRLEREGQGWALAHAHYVRAGIAASREDASTALHHLQRAAETYDSVDMPLHACVMRYRMGQVQGGDEGRSLISDAQSRMRSQSIQSPARWAAMYAPGFSKIASSQIETTH
jgi:hypothetical protein